MEEIYLLAIFLLKKCTVFRVTRSLIGTSKDPDVNTSFSSVNVYSRQILAPSCAAITVPEKESYCTIAPHLKFAALIARISSPRISFHASGQSNDHKLVISQESPSPCWPHIPCRRPMVRMIPSLSLIATPTLRNFELIGLAVPRLHLRLSQMVMKRCRRKTKKKLQKFILIE